MCPQLYAHFVHAGSITGAWAGEFCMVFTFRSQAGNARWEIWEWIGVKQLTCQEARNCVHILRTQQACSFTVTVHRKKQIVRGRCQYFACKLYMELFVQPVKRIMPTAFKAERSKLRKIQSLSLQDFQNSSASSTLVDRYIRKLNIICNIKQKHLSWSFSHNTGSFFYQPTALMSEKRYFMRFPTTQKQSKQD